MRVAGWVSKTVGHPAPLALVRGVKAVYLGEVAGAGPPALRGGVCGGERIGLEKKPNRAGWAFD